MEGKRGHDERRHGDKNDQGPMKRRRFGPDECQARDDDCGHGEGKSEECVVEAGLLGDIQHALELVDEKVMQSVKKFVADDKKSLPAENNEQCG